MQRSGQKNGTKKTKENNGRGKVLFCSQLFCKLSLQEVFDVEFFVAFQKPLVFGAPVGGSGRVHQHPALSAWGAWAPGL
jgi:hypothetical protein